MMERTRAVAWDRAIEDNQDATVVFIHQVGEQLRSEHNVLRLGVLAGVDNEVEDGTLILVVHALCGGAEQARFGHEWLWL